MSRSIPAIYVTPGMALSSCALNPEEKIVLSAVFTLADPQDGVCRLDVPAIAASCGMKPRPARGALNSLIEKGWVEEIPNGKTSYLARTVPLVIPKKEEKKPDKEIFDKQNLVVDEKEVTHLIKVFISSGINPKIKGKAAEARTYGSPWQRHGAHELIMKFTLPTVEKMIGDVAKNSKDPYCPKIDSLYMLLSKWDKCEKFLSIKDNTGYAVV